MANWCFLTSSARGSISSGPGVPVSATNHRYSLRQERRGVWALQGDPDDVRRPPGPVEAQERLGPGVHLCGVAGEGRGLLEAAARILPHPAGERPRGLADVALGIMPDAQGEQLEELAGEVLVGLVLLAVAAVEPDQHGRVGDDGFQHGGEPAQGVRPQRLVLPVHQGDRLDLPVAGGEVAMPEQSHLLAERVGPVEDAIEPADLEQVEVRRRPRRLSQAVDGLGVLGRQRLGPEQPLDARLGPGRQVAEDFRPRRAEAGASVKMRDLAQVPGIIGRRLIPGPGGSIEKSRHDTPPRFIVPGAWRSGYPRDRSSRRP